MNELNLSILDIQNLNKIIFDKLNQYKEIIKINKEQNLKEEKRYS